MDLYTLTNTFLSKDVIDDFVSAIWTERYSAAGDVQLVVPATSDMIEKLAPGTFLALRGTKEVMILDTQSIEEGLMTVIGQSLLEFLNERMIWFVNPEYRSDQPDDSKVVDYTHPHPGTSPTLTPGQFISHVVERMAITPIPFMGSYFTGTTENTNLDWPFEAIERLTLGAIDTSGTAKRITVPIGPLYDGISQLAQKEGIGLSLYLDSAHVDTGYNLKFKTYRGVDHTTGSAFPLVRLLPDMDSISDIKEIRSNAYYKNVVYVWYKGLITTHYAEPTLPKPEGFERRSMVTDAEGEPVARKITQSWGAGQTYTNYVVGASEVNAFREQNAKDALANHNYIRAIDGQTSPHNDYKYGVDYGLGDTIELKSFTGLLSKARVTEYIRSQDKSGEREYPTISVVGEEA